jgi:thiol-disulfide isomerase/thioredoxin
MQVMASPQLAQPFPDFEIDVLSVKQAKSIGPLFVVVWRPNCPTCRLILPYIDRMYSRYRAATIVGIAQCTDGELKEFVKETGLSTVCYADPNLTVSQFLGVSTVPTYWLVGRDGKVSHKGEGWDRTKLEAMAEALARQCSVAYSPLVTSQDNVPSFKPG